MTDKKQIGRVVIYVLLILAILAVIMPIIIGAGYTYPCEDDWSFEMGGKVVSSGRGDFLGALKGTYSYYMTWQGTYLSNFLWYFVRPYDRAGLLGFRVAVIAMCLLFVFAVYFLLKTLAKESMSVLSLALIAYIIAFNTSQNSLEKEFLYWYTGAINYSVGVSLAFITLALTIRLKKEEDKKKIRWMTFIACCTGFLASGCSLEITSVNCSWLLLFLILCVEEIPKKKIITLPFVSAFVGALINAAAPGNFARREATTSGAEYGIADALRDTMICWKNEWNGIFDNKFFIVLLVIAFLVCWVCGTKILDKGISTWKMLLLFPAVFVMQYFTAFPVILGYQSSSLGMYRTVYPYEMLSKLLFLFLTVMFAQWLREHVRLPIWLPCAAALVLSVLIVSRVNVLDNVKLGYSYNVAKELQEGKVQEVGRFREKVLNLLEQCEKGTDVYLRVPGVPASSVTYGMGLTTDQHSLCNSHAAAYFEFNSLAVEYSDEYKFPTE